MKNSLYLFVLVLFTSCALNHSLNKSAINRLTFLSEYVIPYNLQLDSTIVGGLSGIDFDAKTGEYYMICDDRSVLNPARFYKANILIKNSKIDSVIFKQPVFLENAGGSFYPSAKKDPAGAPDPEALRFDSRNNTVVWSSEGERIVNSTQQILENPAVTIADTNGHFIDTLRLPPQLYMSAAGFGPRQNGVFEGLTFTDNKRSLFVSVEEPLYQDGPAAGPGDSSAIVRFIKWDLASKKPIGQYAYKIDPVAHPPFPASAFKINGISDILSVGNEKFIVVERSYSTGRLACTIRVYLASIGKATNINGMESIKNNNDIKFMSKKLLLNMDELGRYVDNVEGVTFGPILPNGKRSLLFIVDNNFNPLEKSQLFLFQIN